MKTAVIGYGKSGQTAEALLKKAGASVVDIYDDKSGDCRKIAEFANSYDRVAVSPGIDMERLELKVDNLTSEVELAYEALKGEKKILVMTGTNGKSTVTWLTAQLLGNAGLRAVACGNIGKTFGESVFEGRYDVYVLELSSFQIELLNNFQAELVSITNLAPDHMDRYASFEEYAQAKMRVLKFIKENGVAVLGEADELLKRALHCKCRKVLIDENLYKFPVLKGNILDFGKYRLFVDRFPLFGKHNLLNLSHALIAADSLLSFSGDITEHVEKLTGLPHRCEYSGIIRGIRFINDSKATNVYSTLACLKGLKGGNVILLGGRDKNSDFSLLANELNRTASAVIAFGEAAKVIKEKLKGLLVCDFLTAKTLEDAVKTGLNVAEPGANVILSPACSSYDSFKNFEERGKRFMEYVKELGGQIA
jgi:UDP-N-acetylmuramoylalanine--D-glutamate ligase